jgi:hypothetical protein
MTFLFYGAFFFLVLIMSNLPSSGLFFIHGRDALMDLFIWHLGSITLVTSVIHAVALTEPAGGGFDMLRLSLLTPREFVWGKFQAALRASTPLVFASLLTYAPMVILFLPFRDAPVLPAVSFGTLGICILAAISTAFFASSISNRSGTAVLISLSLTLILFGFSFYILKNSWGTLVAALPTPTAAYIVDLELEWGAAPSFLYRTANWVISAALSFGFPDEHIQV